MITVVDLSRSGSTAHNTVGDNQRACDNHRPAAHKLGRSWASLVSDCTA